MNAQIKILFFLAVLILNSSLSFSQKQYNVWAFGERGGLNFNNTPVTGFKSKAESDFFPSFNTSVCNKDGVLMFYTDGYNVWNRDGFKLPKYNNWWILAGEKIMPLACPVPGNDTLYYLFGVCDGANKYQLQAITVRMMQPGDIEEVVYPRPSVPNTFQTRLKYNASVAVAGTSHCDGKSYWIVTYSDHGLYSYHVTATGINLVPSITNVAENVIADSTFETGKSNIKFSANGEKVMLPVLSENKIVVYDFDNATGKFSNPLVITAAEHSTLEEAELSPEGSKLYVADYYFNDPDDPRLIEHGIYQLDLTAGTLDQIMQTKTQLLAISDRDVCTRSGCFYVYRGMQLAPDGKIYVGMRYATRPTVPIDESLSVIEAPEEKGLNCRYRKNGQKVGVKYKFLGYNYIRSLSYTLKENGITVQKQNCADKPVNFGILFSKVDSVRWDFGDPTSGTGNISTSLNPSHTYPGPGSYTVKAVIYSKCIADTATSIITIKPDVSVKVPAQIKDTSICVGDVLTLNARDGTSHTYQWENGLILADRTINEAGHYRVMIMNDCSLDMKEFNVTYDRCPCAVYVPTAFTPNGDGLNDVFKPATQCYAKQYKFTVFNRFGQVIFTSTDPQKGWDGFIGPYRQATGTFIWTLQYQDPNSKKMNSEKGTVLLIR